MYIGDDFSYFSSLGVNIDIIGINFYPQLNFKDIRKRIARAIFYLLDFLCGQIHWKESPELA